MPIEVYLDGKRMVARDNVHERGYEYETVDLQAGKLYPIRVDFHEVHGDADIRLVWAPPHAGYEEEALKVARQADVVLMFLGLSPRLEGEEMKVQWRVSAAAIACSLGIPRVQEALLQQVSALGKPVVLVLLNGSAVAVNWAREHVPAIVELWYPGQAGGTALADVLFGDYNPAGRLPVTFYKSEDQLPPFDDYSMKGRTYRYFEGEPLYPFGYGLSYTTFTYRNLQAPDEARAGSPVKVSVEVENSGKRDWRRGGAVVCEASRSRAGVARIRARAAARRREEDSGVHGLACHGGRDRVVSGATEPNCRITR